MGAAVRSCVVCEFDNREECGPIVLLEVSTDTKVLGSFKHAINRIIICPINLIIKSFFARKLD